MDFLLDFNDFKNPMLLEHHYDSVVNGELGYPVSGKRQSLILLIDYINQMIEEHQIKDIKKQDDQISFTIKDRKYVINKSGYLTLYKVQSSYEGIKNIEVLQWIFGNKEEALDALRTIGKYKGRVRTIDAGDIIALRELNKKIGKRSQEDYDKNFKTSKRYKNEEVKVNVPIDKGTALSIYNKISSL